MAWEDQGRQEHGWFGHGKGPVPDAAAQRTRKELRGRAWAAFELALDDMPIGSRDVSGPHGAMRDLFAALVPL